MDFLKRMKSREITEMVLKTITAVMVSFILIILMEGMIFSIYMNKINDRTTGQYNPMNCVVYCEEVKDDQYKVYVHDTENNSWQVLKLPQTKAQIEDIEHYKVVWSKPNAFDVSINGTHYIVMAVFVVAVLGLYGWRFYKLNKEYKGFEKKFKKSGNIF